MYEKSPHLAIFVLVWGINIACFWFKPAKLFILFYLLI